MKHFIAFIKGNKSDLLQVAFVFFVLAVGLTELHKTLPFMPWHSNIFIPIFVLLYIVYFLILESVKSNRIRNAILYKISDSAVGFCHQNKRNLVSVAMVILAISGVDMINRYCHLNLPKNSINGLREKAVVLSVDNS